MAALTFVFGWLVGLVTLPFVWFVIRLARWGRRDWWFEACMSKDAFEFYLVPPGGRGP